MESSGTPKCLELDSKAQNTSHWGVLGVIGKVLKRRHRKWPRIGHLDIFRPSYGQKKGRESNWQFDSRPLKVGNRPLLDVRFESATWRWKISTRATTLVQTSSRSNSAVGSYGSSKSRESREFVPLGCSPHGASQSILYGGWWWHPPSPGRGESCGPKCPWLVPTPKGVLESELTTWVVCFDADSSLIN